MEDSAMEMTLLIFYLIVSLITWSIGIRRVKREYKVFMKSGTLPKPSARGVFTRAILGVAMIFSATGILAVVFGMVYNLEIERAIYVPILGGVLTFFMALPIILVVYKLHKLGGEK